MWLFKMWKCLECLIDAHIPIYKSVYFNVVSLVDNAHVCRCAASLYNIKLDMKGGVGI